ncbi:hypothetical protein TVAG_218260 [Trichomonas vaginalis G3]|uniref:Uncharacterized protein n=1 Tax=Trichomonas vaginalis (strain ATCC PRA-98 / G3) TaxID=412133 RepID=A2FD19_TRIV3|nr:hypothetical protein TVAGG3_0423050 [Trichomonas vaginalis G3]EAX97212.1 hypothetical protein TVAG_218260 [Trichomonas vaginalis G3]KAI5536201.1 hypothetical protein TVAGG3_0423050 [Trichomonas vaginalis G3]|eukprot:XP_001310142.1 hypothetical protein [Trichomonas vaginalis G3]
MGEAPAELEVIDEPGMQVEESSTQWNPMPASEFFSTIGADNNFKVPTQSKSRPPETILIPSLEANNGPVIPVYSFSKKTTKYEIEEIQKAADNALKGKNPNMDDPYFVAEVLEELTSRRIDLISNGYYKKAQEVIDKINEIRNLFKKQDFIKYRESYIENLKNRCSQQHDYIKELQKTSKERLENKKAEAQQQMDRLFERQEQQRDALISDWQSPAKLRQFNKQSPELLQYKYLEKLTALVGDLAVAEEMKHKNARLEKEETAERYRMMTDEFEKARKSLDIALDQEFKNNRQQLQNEIAIVEENNRIELERAREKNIYLNKLLKEEQFAFREAKKKLDKTPRIMPLNNTIPMLQRTGTNINKKNMFKYNQADKINSNPLNLPPLIVKPKKQRKLSSSFK